MYNMQRRPFSLLFETCINYWKWSHRSFLPEDESGLTPATQTSLVWMCSEAYVHYYNLKRPLSLTRSFQVFEIHHHVSISGTKLAIHLVNVHQVPRLGFLVVPKPWDTSK